MLSMYAFGRLKAELEKIDELDFIFTSPTFLPTGHRQDSAKSERVPSKLDRERSLYGLRV